MWLYFIHRSSWFHQIQTTRNSCKHSHRPESCFLNIKGLSTKTPLQNALREGYLDNNFTWGWGRWSLLFLHVQCKTSTIPYCYWFLKVSFINMVSCAMYFTWKCEPWLEVMCKTLIAVHKAFSKTIVFQCGSIILWIVIRLRHVLYTV